MRGVHGKFTSLGLEHDKFQGVGLVAKGAHLDRGDVGLPNY